MNILHKNLAFNLKFANNPKLIRKLELNIIKIMVKNIKVINRQFKCFKIISRKNKKSVFLGFRNRLLFLCQYQFDTS